MKQYVVYCLQSNSSGAKCPHLIGMYSTPWKAVEARDKFVAEFNKLDNVNPPLWTTTTPWIKLPFVRRHKYLQYEDSTYEVDLRIDERSVDRSNFMIWV